MDINQGLIIPRVRIRREYLVPGFRERHQPRTRSRRREDIYRKRSSVWLDLIEYDVEEEGEQTSRVKTDILGADRAQNRLGPLICIRKVMSTSHPGSHAGLASVDECFSVPCSRAIGLLSPRTGHVENLGLINSSFESSLCAIVIGVRVS